MALEAQPQRPSDSLGMHQYAWADQAVQVVYFDQPNFRPIRGNRELMLATWFARMGELGLPLGPVEQRQVYGDPSKSHAWVMDQHDTIELERTVGIAVERRLFWHAEQSLLACQIRAFGPGTRWTMLNGWSKSLMPGAAPYARASSAQRPPMRSIWSARVRLPFVRDKSSMQQYEIPALFDAPDILRVLQAHDPKPRHWKLERRTVDPVSDTSQAAAALAGLPDSGWEPINLDELDPDASAKRLNCTEDWFFDPSAFALKARVVSLDWISADGGTWYRLRFLD